MLSDDLLLRLAPHQCYCGNQQAAHRTEPDQFIDVHDLSLSQSVRLRISAGFDTGKLAYEIGLVKHLKTRANALFSWWWHEGPK